MVRPGAEPEQFIIVMGERRYRASKLAGLEDIPAIVREDWDAFQVEGRR